MKKILTIALVAVLAATSVFAGVSFSGKFNQGYTFKFAKDKDFASTPWKTNEAKFVIKASDDDGIWSVNLKNTGKLDTSDAWAANASVSLTKILAAAGVDTGDFSLALSLGNNSKMTALSAYNDVTGNEYYKLKNNGSESFQLAAAYGKLVKFNIAADPTNNVNKPSTVLSLSTEPVSGLSVAAAYAYRGYFDNAVAGKGVTADHMIGASAKVDVAKLADLDFKLNVSAYDNIAFGNVLKYNETSEKVDTPVENNKLNSFAVAVEGGVDVVDGFVEFAMKNEENANVYALNTQVNFNVVDGLGLDAYFNIADLANTGDSFKVGADASYKLSGVEFALKAEYASKDTSFSVTPKMIIVF